MITNGTYRHYKGNLYKVLGTAIHSESLEEMVVYERLDKSGWWVRPLKMFQESVVVNGKNVPRFELVTI
jgi:hypothetical protein